MVSENVNSLQSRKLKIQVELNELLHSKDRNQDKINELKSEILYLEKQIERIVGKKEIQRRAEVKRKKQGIDDINRNNYYNFKNKFKKISSMTIATNRIVGIIDKIQDTQIEEKVRIKVV